MPRVLLAAVLLATALLGLRTKTAVAQEVSYDFDKSADFSTLHRYTWIRGRPVNDDINHRRIVEAISEQLAAKGLQRVAGSEGPDVLVAYYASFANDLEVHAMTSGWGYRFAPSRYGSARVEEVLVGTLVVEVIDAWTRSTIWRGTVEREIDVKASPEKREKNIGKAAEKLFKHYPPTS